MTDYPKGKSGLLSKSGLELIKQAQKNLMPWRVNGVKTVALAFKLGIMVQGQDGIQEVGFNRLTLFVALNPWTRYNLCVTSDMVVPPGSIPYMGMQWTLSLRRHVIGLWLSLGIRSLPGISKALKRLSLHVLPESNGKSMLSRKG